IIEQSARRFSRHGIAPGSSRVHRGRGHSSSHSRFVVSLIPSFTCMPVYDLAARGVERRFSQVSPSIKEDTMRLAPATTATVWTLLALAVSCPPHAPGRQFGPRPSIRWAGQDGHDYVSPNNRLEPSEIQDMHLVISGLDPRREVMFVDVTTTSGGDQWQ